jgi:hypothetical protein
MKKCHLAENVRLLIKINANKHHAKAKQ